MVPKKSAYLVLVLAALSFLGSCAPLPRPAAPAGIALRPGNYLESYWRAPGATFNRSLYAIEPFTVESSEGIAPDALKTMLKTELTQAFDDNGLNLKPDADTRVSGTVKLARIRGHGLKFLMHKLTGELVVSGAITRGNETLFAFADTVRITSPLPPGPKAAKANELLFQQVVQAFAHHLLDELLLYGLPESGE